jgi:hypothetical protein
VRAVRSCFAVAIAASLVAGMACDGDESPGTGVPGAGSPIGARTVSVPTGAAPPGGATPTAAAIATPIPPPNPTELAIQRTLNDLVASVLTPDDLPDGYEVRLSQVATKRDIVASQAEAIRKVSDYFAGPDFEGAWVRLFVLDDPQTGLSSIVYRFRTPEGALGLVQTFASLQPADYPAAQRVERAPADDIEDGAQLMRYLVGNSTTLEYTWAQGKFAGQVILRRPGAAELPDDAGFVVSLARIQAERIRGAGQGSLP